MQSRLSQTDRTCIENELENELGYSLTMDEDCEDHSSHKTIVKGEISKGRVETTKSRRRLST